MGSRRPGSKSIASSSRCSRSIATGSSANWPTRPRRRSAQPKPKPRKKTRAALRGARGPCGTRPHGLLFDDPCLMAFRLMVFMFGRPELARRRGAPAKFDGASLEGGMREQLEALRAAALAELGDSASAEQIEAVRVRVLGRGGELTDVMRRMREVAAEERPVIGQLVNQIKRELEGRIEALQDRMRAAALERSLGEARLDVTLPGARIPRGRLHPLTLVTEQMLDI